ncbi:type II toxin-antitoxin system PemK/MazF family toxin [Brevibacterium album]|uniref:type II toxin-antitoxin system PemK/MazF family toxin n=1 Tax=Brevibacterium album TaxID=417948 RepID=UPI00040695C8
MDLRKLGRRALRAGVKQGIGYMKRSGRDTTVLRMVDGMLSGTDGRPEERAPRGTGTRDGAGTRGRNRGKSEGDGGAGGGRARSTRPSGSRQPGSGAQAREGLAHAREAARPRPAQGFPKRPDAGYPGDYTGAVKPVYAPDLDGEADPGEIVWAWVPFEEDHSRGKDRPVLVIGHDGRWLLGLMLSSRDHVPGSPGEVHIDGSARWINIGTGDWDSRRRPSEIRLDRVIRIAPGAVRREGAIMPMEQFAKVVESV